ncbi:22805_t:CDS:2, partial [Dentiscutata erythropus]
MKFIRKKPSVSYYSVDVSWCLLDVTKPASLVACCATRQGSLIVQNYLKRFGNCSYILEQVSLSFCDMMKDPYANHVCQCLITLCNESQRDFILSLIGHKVPQLARDAHGNYVLQCLIKNITTKSQAIRLISYLAKDVKSLIMDSYGNFVLQKTIEFWPTELTQFIYHGVCENILDVACDSHGCFVVKKCFEYGTYLQKSLVQSAIVANTLILSQNFTGRIILQYVLNVGEPLYFEAIKKQLQGTR